MLPINRITTSGQLGPMLKQLRMDKRLSQAQLGASIGLSQERISRIESRPESVTLDQLLTVLMALDAAFVLEHRSAPQSSSDWQSFPVNGSVHEPGDESW